MHLLVAVTFWRAGTRNCARGRNGKPSQQLPTGVSACTLMATRAGRPLSRGETRKWEPFLAFWREKVARWWAPAHQQLSLQQVFPGGELNEGQKGKREVSTYLPEMWGEIAGQGRGTAP